MREALEGRPEQQRTRLQYDRVLDAYRAIYHGDPASPKADASIAAVADLLAEEGRVFQDAKLIRDAIGQYEFLRHQYPESRFRFSALLTEGEIYQGDFGDLAETKATYLEFLRLYPESPLAVEAKSELRNIRRAQASRRPEQSARQTSSRPAASSSGTSASGGSHRNAVLTAALASQNARQSSPRQASAAGSERQPASAGIATPPPAANRSAARAPSRGAVSRGTPAQMEESDIPPLLPPTEVGPSATTTRRGSEPLAETTLAADLNAPPPPRRSPLPLITGIRHWSTPVYTRVAIDLQSEVRYTAARVPGPDRIFFDLYGTRLSPELVGRSVEVTDDGFLSQIRVAQFGSNIVRLVLDVNSVSDYSAFFLSNPSRLIIDVHGRRGGPPPMETAKNGVLGAGIGIGPLEARPPLAGSATTGDAATRTAGSAVSTPMRARTPTGIRAPQDGAASANPNRSATEPRSALADVASLSRQPNEVRATRRPTTAPVVASVAGTTPAAEPDADPPAATTRRSPRAAQPAAVRAADDVPPAEAGEPGIPAGPATAEPRTTASTSAGPVGGSSMTAGPGTLDAHSPNMMRALGLKINRIVIDAGHGGHDSGTLGPGGLMEKDVVLDVALRLGTLLKERLGASVVYTRSDDTFIPLETRTAIANQAQADLFISVHGNSSPDASARGVEVYYLNFTSSADALEVAARENASSDESIHQLSDLVKKIALQAKINESREFAEDVDQSLYAGLEEGNPGLKDRGVKKAPFVVLIGANMPSILAEISFVTNPQDAQELRQGGYRERIAESLYRGVARYVSSMNGLRVAQR
jgi:N-acetylmuramoyl-L-alanine amidase